MFARTLDEEGPVKKLVALHRSVIPGSKYVYNVLVWKVGSKRIEHITSKEATKNNEGIREIPIRCRFQTKQTN